VQNRICQSFHQSRLFVECCPPIFFLVSRVGQSETGLRVGEGKQECCEEAGGKEEGGEISQLV
jgi:hypothetical protein